MKVAIKAHSLTFCAVFRIVIQLFMSIYDFHDWLALLMNSDKFFYLFKATNTFLFRKIDCLLTIFTRSYLIKHKLIRFSMTKKEKERKKKPAHVIFLLFSHLSSCLIFLAIWHSDRIMGSDFLSSLSHSYPNSTIHASTITEYPSINLFQTQNQSL